MGRLAASALLAVASLGACDSGKQFVISNPCAESIRAGGFIDQPPKPVLRRLLVDVPAGGSITVSDLGTSSAGSALWLVLSKGLDDQRFILVEDTGEGQVALAIPESQCPWIEGR